MLYKLLGMAIWKGGKLVLRRRYGSTYVPKPLLAGAVLAVAGGVAAIILRNNGSHDLRRAVWQDLPDVAESSAAPALPGLELVTV